MKWLLSLIMVLVALPSWGATITTVTLKDKSGSPVSNYPLTFGMVFKQGDATTRVYLNDGTSDLPTQTDVKVTWSDGSIRQAVVSAIVPSISANGTTTLSINTTGTAAGTTPMDKAAILATDLGATINLTGLSGSGYSGDVTADLRGRIGADSFSYWLSGGVITEILSSQKLNNSLSAHWEARIYPGTPYVRISHVVENVEVSYRGAVSYTVAINQGHASPAQVYGPKSVNHLMGTRWRKVFWLGTAPPEVEVHYDLPYLISTGHIPSYDTSLVVDPAEVTSMWNTWQGRDTDIFGNTDVGGKYFAGLASKNFPDPGGRPEIGLLPKWCAMYLLTWDSRMREITLRQAEMLANAPSHWRVSDPAKTLYGKIFNIDDYRRSRADTEYNFTRYGDLPAAIGDYSYGLWVIDRAHQGAFNYLPYLVTGERFYLDELYFWAAWNLSSLAVDPGGARDWEKGYIRDQVRGEAWGFRNIVHAAVMAPDSDPEKTYFNSKITNNINMWLTPTPASGATPDFLAFPLRNWEVRYGTGDILNGLSGATASTSPWMDDFVSLVMNHAKALGYPTGPILDEQHKFQVGRFTHPDFNPFNGATYRFPAATAAGYVSTWAQANSLYTNQPTSFPPDSNSASYDLIALAALSQLTNYPGGQQAYDFLLANVPEQNMLSANPTWALVPPPDVEPPAATCSDGVQNQGETGIDCGGPCAACGGGCTPTNGGVEICGNGVDEDCSGADLACGSPGSGIIRALFRGAVH